MGSGRPSRGAGGDRKGGGAGLISKNCSKIRERLWEDDGTVFYYEMWAGQEVKWSAASARVLFLAKVQRDVASSFALK